MIVHRLEGLSSGEAERGSLLRLVTQTDHAALAAEILGLWRADDLPEHPRRPLLLDAVRSHDNGWWEQDAAPSRRPDGRPHDFRDLPTTARLEIWQRGISRSTSSPWIRALIAHHAVVLHVESRDRALAAAVDSWRSRRDAALEETTIERVPAPLATLEADYSWLALADSLSLAACAGWSGPVERRGYRFGTRPTAPDAPIELWIDPFPLAGSTRFTLRGRLLPDRSYATDTDLALELASARWHAWSVRVVPVASDPPRAKGPNVVP